MLIRLLVLSGFLLLEACSTPTSITPNAGGGLPAVSVARFSENTVQEFAPSRGEIYSLPIQVPESTQSITLAIYTPDGEILRTIKQTDAVAPGLTQLSWDGKDDSGQVVPDEAYVPVITLELANGTKQTLDPRNDSGGELVEQVPVSVTQNREIAYQLPAASRVLIRAGIKGGPMLRNLSSWQPKSAGKNIFRWDGKDQSGLLDIRTEPNLGILVIAFKLPEHSILTYGNQTLGYRDYRLAKGWADKVIAPDKMQLNRNGVAVSPHYYSPRSYDAVPDVSLTLPSNLSKSANGFTQVILNSPVSVKADIAEQDRWMMKQSLYEVAFFIDHEFVAEEEQGYVPLTWQWLPQQLKP